MKKLLLLMFCFGLVSSSVFAQDEQETEDLTDYKIASLAAIDNISKIKGGISLGMWESLAFDTAIAGAKAGLDECATKEDMQGVVTGLRALAIFFLQLKVSFNDGLVFTGLIGNQSFDTGDLSLWTTVGFDLSKVDVNQVTNDITTKGDISGLIDAISINEWKENTKAVENEGDNYLSGGHNKYYLNSENQLMMQPILGLPAGIYNFSAKVTAPILTNVYLNVLVLSSDVVQEFIGYELPSESDLDIDFNTLFSSISLIDIITGKVDYTKLATETLPTLLGMEGVADWSDMLSNTSKIWENIEPLLQYGKLYSKSIWVTNANAFSNVDMRFMVDEGDVVIIGLNAGITQFIGAEQFKADNLRFTGLHSVGGILTSVRADLAEALKGLSPVEANYNADATDATMQPAFSYDKELTENYNNAYYAAKNSNIKRMRDILTQEDLNDFDVVDEKLNLYKAEIQANIQALNKAKEAFDKGAFIAPAANKQFNILMNSSSLPWTGYAVTVDENLKMNFSQKPGRSAFALTFNFEKASNEYPNKLYAFVNDGVNKYYLGEKDGNLVLTTDKAEAVIVTAVPSYTVEGEISLMVNDKLLGSTADESAFVMTEGIDQMTGLAVRPAANMTVKVSVPASLGVSTVILPFDSKLPSGVSACSVTGVATDLPYVVDEAVTSLKANTPYCIMAAAGDYTFSGVPHAVLPSYRNGLLIGTHAPYTTQGGNEYKLILDMNDYVPVFSCADGKHIAEGECYLKTDNPNSIIFFRQTDAITGIDEVESSRLNTEGYIYNLAGQQIVNSKLQKGIYIQKGKKVLR